MIQPINLQLNWIQREIYLVGPDAALQEFSRWIADVVKWFWRNPRYRMSND